MASVVSFWRQLTRCLKRRATVAPKVEVQIYSRKSCHLCDVAKSQLEQARKEFEFSLDEIDVDSDDDLASRYGSEVPVIIVDGKLRFRGTINPVLLRRLLRGSRRY